VTALPSKLDFHAENAAIKLRPFFARSAKDRLGLFAPILTMPDLDPMSGVTARLRTRAIRELRTLVTVLPRCVSAWKIDPCRGVIGVQL
jgi:hypothetical protein